MEIPYSIRNIIGDRPYSVDCVGMSDAQVICFEDMVLKIGPERNRRPLSGYCPVSPV